MKENARKLGLVLRIVLSAELFYAISVHSGYITLQGKYNTSVIKEMIKHKWTYKIEETGYVVLTKKNVIVTFTD